MALMAAVRIVLICGASLVAGVCGISPSDKIPDYLAKYGIEVQTYETTTDDGYVLSLFRMPRHGAPVVLFQHGILSSAWCWIDNDPDIAPALQVYNMGYDVWLSNSRGNTLSRKHTKWSPTLNKEYWNFSFADMGRHDVPTNIKHVLKETGKASLTYVGHSQGTSQFFSAMTDPNSKAFVEKTVNLFVALAPITYLSHQKAKLLRVVADLHLGALIEAAFPFGFLQYSTLDLVSKTLCTLTGGGLCKIGVDVICGTSQEDTDAAITNVSAHFPAGTSVKCLDHYEQLVNSGKFEDYDYGRARNLQVYNRPTPPNFNLSHAKVPTALFIGSHDDLGDPTDEDKAASELPKSTLVFSETFPGYSHITWIAGTWSAFQAWFPKLQALLQKHNPLKNELLV